jgi:hypothetical protein
VQVGTHTLPAAASRRRAPRSLSIAWVAPICRTLGVSASAYYQRNTGQRSARAVEDERLLGRIHELHAATTTVRIATDCTEERPQRQGI